MNVHRHGWLDVPLFVAEATEDEKGAVTHHAGIAIHLVALAAMEARDVILSLLDGVLVVCAFVRLPQEARSFVFYDEAVVHRVGTAFNQANLVSGLNWRADGLCRRCMQSFSVCHGVRCRAGAVYMPGGGR